MSSSTFVQYEIEDKRIQKDFTGISFTKFKKLDVKKQLLKSLLDGKIEDSNYWCIELVCAGHYLDIWECILLFMSKYIHVANPKIPIYIEMRMKSFKEILTNGYVDNELKMRNNDKIRKLFAEVISVLCFSRKKHSYVTMKIKRSEFDLSEMTHRLKASNLDFAAPIFLKDDPKEFFIAVNEFAYCISKQGLCNGLEASYWLEWVIEFESMCKKKKEPCHCQRRTFVQVQEKSQMDIIWIVWNALLYESTKRNDTIQKIVRSLLNLFCLRYSSGVKRKRKYIMYFAIALLTEEIPLDKPFIENKEAVESVVQGIHLIYKQIKKHEVLPETAYLFNGLQGKNLEQSIQKIDMLNSAGFIPRNN